GRLVDFAKARRRVDAIASSEEAQRRQNSPDDPARRVGNSFGRKRLPNPPTRAWDGFETLS
ncbi:MAG: hypothetical protein ACREJ2_07820, partial [Planctomycetota bacterium]